MNLILWKRIVKIINRIKISCKNTFFVVVNTKKKGKCFTMTAFAVQTVSNLRICVHTTWISCEQDDERIILIHSGTSCSWGKLNDQTASSERNKFERSTWKFIWKKKDFHWISFFPLTSWRRVRRHLHNTKAARHQVRVQTTC